MSDVMDSAIKLFGKTIALGRKEAANINESSSTAKTCTFNDDGDEDNRDADIRSWNSSLNEEIPVIGIEHEQGDEHKEYSGKVLSIHKQEDDASHQIMQEPEPPAVVSDANKNPKATSTDREISSIKPSNSGGQGERGSFQERTTQKPDKILPCPRCYSMNTKFCYYNNYNVNQPRHLCKICQRFWTAGGTLRNVPVGAGCRKTRSSSASSNFRQLIASGTSPTAHLDFASGVYNGTLGNIATVPPFNSDAPLCNSMASVFNLAEKTNCGEDQSSGSSITASCSSERRSDSSLQESVGSSYHGFPTQVTCVPRPPWSYPLLNKGQWTSAVPTAFCPPVFPASSHPAPAYWGCTVPSSWSAPCVSPSPSSFDQCFSSSGLNSPTLGKHSRDGDILNQPKLKKESAKMDDHVETSVLVPKTLRIDDPTEAAKSSIWTTLGIRNDKGGSSHSGGLFKGLQSTSKDKNHVSEPSLLLQANPAAFSRSLDFHESS